MSYDGMTDPLGQSQVIPYLAGLSAAGYDITLVSFEKKERYDQYKDLVGGLLRHHRISWQPLSYTRKPPVIATLYDICRLRRKTAGLMKIKSFGAVHCRSYITALTGLRMKKKYGIPFIFDMRGFWADERVDGKLWDQRNPLYRIIYHYFKRKEKQFLLHADKVISLTANAAEEMQRWKLKENEPLPVQVIPCCADLNHFSHSHVNGESRLNWKNKLHIDDNDFVLGYLGAIGTWYMLDEMLDFFKRLLRFKPQAVFLFVTMEPDSLILEAAGKKGIDAGRIRITFSARSDLPSLLDLFMVAVFFIRPDFSKKASSPTKQGEIMGMGIPLICNSGIGDTDKIMQESNAGILVKEFNDAAYDHVIGRIDELLKRDPGLIRAGAEQYYSLATGIELFRKVYDEVVKKDPLPLQL